MAAKLKVFTTGDGFTDYVVAVSSRPKALAAWGVSQDLFDEGVAHETDDPALVKAALARPGEVLRRKAGAPHALARAPAPASRKRAGPSKAALKRVADLEHRLQALEAEQRDRLAAIETARQALDRREERLRTGQSAARDELTARLEQARRALKRS